VISAVLCTYNRASTLSATLESLRGMSVPARLPWELLIVDNNSSDDTARVVADHQRVSASEVRYVFEPEQGHSRARNRGIREARGAILVFTDDDVSVDPHWLARIHETYERFDCLGVGGKIIPVWPCAKPAWLDGDRSARLMQAIVSFDLGDETCVLRTPPFGANMSFRRAAFERYGLFRTDLGRTGRDLAGGEDTEFARRLLRNGETLIYNPAAVVYHPVEAERLTRTYWQRWYFAYGRIAARRAGGPDGEEPPWRGSGKLARRLASTLLGWTLTVDSTRRFHHKLSFLQALGQLREMCTVRRRDGRQVPRLS
jgi:glycosyltransferase involved in cell wall biosynthesis